MCFHLQLSLSKKEGIFVVTMATQEEQGLQEEQVLQTSRSLALTACFQIQKKRKRLVRRESRKLCGAVETDGADFTMESCRPCSLTSQWWPRSQKMHSGKMATTADSQGTVGENQ